MVGPRPGGMRGGRMLRFAEADTASASAFRLRGFNTAEPGKGLAVKRQNGSKIGFLKQDDGQNGAKALSYGNMRGKMAADCVSYSKRNRKMAARSAS